MPRDSLLTNDENKKPSCWTWNDYSSNDMDKKLVRKYLLGEQKVFQMDL